MADLIQMYTADIKALVGRTAQNMVAIGEKLQTVKAQLPHGQWEQWLRREFDWGLTTAWNMIRVAERFKSSKIEDLRIDPSALCILAPPSVPAAAAEEARAQARQGQVISVRSAKALVNKHRGVVTLDAYKAGQALPMVQPAVEPTAPDVHAVFNKTNAMVDWAKFTWNPVHGCLHNCIYCFARDIANRFYPEKFAPTFHPERLHAPHNTPVPPEAATDMRYRSVFVVSMGDLFGKWVPQEWIDAVLAEVRAAPQWTFLFLSKFPQRMAQVQWPDNAWVGTTVDEQYRVEIAERAFRTIEAPVKWLSCEPLRERLTFSSLDMFDWVVLGGQSASTQAPAFQPPWDWVEDLVQQARAAHCLVYFKPNLETRPQEYPGQVVLHD
jgi:protein gp37